MPLPLTVFLCLPWLLSGLALGLDRYSRRLPKGCDDLWRLPKPSSLR